MMTRETEERETTWVGKKENQQALGGTLKSRQQTLRTQAEKDEPQPQVVTALGLRMTN